MTFTPKTWQDKPVLTTPIIATDLNRMEAGIVEGTQAATEVQAGNVELASSSEMTAGTDLTRVPSVKRVVDWTNDRIGDAIADHTHVASDITSGTFDLDLMPVGITITLIYNGTSWPSRPDTSTDYIVIWADFVGTGGIPGTAVSNHDIVLQKQVA